MTQQCRLCAEFKSKQELASFTENEIHNSIILEKITTCFHLDFTDISLPKTICHHCWKKVKKTYEFLEQIREAQTHLEKIKPSQEDQESRPELNFNSDFDQEDINPDDETKDFIKTRTIITNPNIKSMKKKLKIEDLNKDPAKAIDRAERSEIIRRIKDEWKTYKWICFLCKIELPSLESLRNHFQQVHQKPPQYTCKECNRVYDSYYSFKRHHRKHRKEFNYRCQICSRFFYLKIQYEAHLETHSVTENQDEKTFVCPHCGKNYKSGSSLRGHMHAYHTMKRKFKCETCHKVLQSLASVYYHQKIHKGDKDFTCEQCGKSFMKASNLKYHTESAHSDAKPFSCPHCPRTFKLAQLLKIHLQVHSNEKNHACETCGKRFNRKGTLTRHSSVHTGVLAFECEFCKKKFRTKQLLKVHIRQHTGERPYTCSECHHDFTDSSNYVKHMKGKHGVITTRKVITS